MRGKDWSIGIDYMSHSIHLTMIKFYVGVEWRDRHR
jgi:hypothetical protein